MSLQALIAIGKAQLRVIGLNPQRLTVESEARVPGAATWGGMDYQTTGLGEQRHAIVARTAPHVFKGLDALEILFRQHRRLEPVNYIRLGSNFAGRRVGLVIIREIFVQEEHLHPFDGVGRIVDVELDLVRVGDPR